MLGQKEAELSEQNLCFHVHALQNTECNEAQSSLISEIKLATQQELTVEYHLHWPDWEGKPTPTLAQQKSLFPPAIQIISPSDIHQN